MGDSQIGTIYKWVIQEWVPFTNGWDEALRIRSFAPYAVNLSVISAKLWQDPARIDIQWVGTIECQYWQDPARIWEEITNCRKTRIIRSRNPLVDLSDLTDMHIVKS